MILDASDLIVGRLAVHAAKNALLGSDIAIVNCEKAAFTGSRENVLGKFKQQRQRGSPFQGPFIKRKPDMIVKRSIRGMLPYKKEKGRLAFGRIKCYEGVPSQFEGKKFDTIKGANVSKLPNRKYIYVGDISHELGAR